MIASYLLENQGNRRMQDLPFRNNSFMPFEPKRVTVQRSAGYDSSRKDVPFHPLPPENKYHRSHSIPSSRTARIV